MSSSGVVLAMSSVSVTCHARTSHAKGPLGSFGGLLYGG